MPEEIEHKREKSEKEKLFEKILEHLSYWEGKEIHLLFRDGVQTALAGKEIQETSLNPSSEEFKNLKKKRYKKLKNAKIAAERIKKGEAPGTEKLNALLHYINRPGRNEEEEQKIIDTHSESLRGNDIDNDEKKYIEERVAFHKQRMTFYAEERNNLLAKVKNLLKEK